MTSDKEYTYEDMVQLHQENKITWVQFIESLPEFHPDWDEWLSDNHREKDEQAAKDYLKWSEECLYR